MAAAALWHSAASPQAVSNSFCACLCRIGLRPVHAPEARFARWDRPKAYPTGKSIAGQKERGFSSTGIPACVVRTTPDKSTRSNACTTKAPSTADATHLCPYVAITLSVGETNLTPGTHIFSYRIETLLGVGGMGTVYRALDTKLNRPVAIRFLSSDVADAAARRGFQREAEMARSLNHPDIVTVYDVGEFEGQQCLVTEFVDGGTLRSWLKIEKRIWKQIVDLLGGVAGGLAAAHTAGILHRDIKPVNVLVARNGVREAGRFRTGETRIHHRKRSHPPARRIAKHVPA